MVLYSISSRCACHVHVSDISDVHERQSDVLYVRAHILEESSGTVIVETVLVLPIA